MGTSNVAGITLPSGHSGNDNVTFATPLPASLGTLTGPRNWLPQQRPGRRTVERSGPLALGNSTSATG